MEKRITLVLGIEGSGKTTLVKALTKDENRLIILDHVNLEYRAGVILCTLSDLTELCNRQSLKRFRLILRFSNDVEILAALRFAYELGNCTVVVEEIDSLCNPAYISPELKAIVSYGRHRNVKLVGVSRRPAEINRLLSSQARQLYTFQQSEPRDLLYLKQRGFDPVAVQTLEKFQYLKLP